MREQGGRRLNVSGVLRHLGVSRSGYNTWKNRKRSCLPDGPKVGSVALSPRGDWRMPSDASVNMWIKDIETLEKEL